MKQGTAIVAFLVAGMVTAAPAGGSGRSVSVAVGSTEHDAEAASLQLQVTGSPDSDEISVGFDTTHTQYVVTSTHPVNPPAPPCTQISSSQIQCPAADFTSFSASLGTGNDLFTVAPSVVVPASLSGASGRDQLRGGGGPDTLLGGAGADRLLGRSGEDTLKGAKGRDVLRGANGQDVLEGDNGRDVLQGGTGGDVLKGGKGRDRLLGGPGRDVEKQ